MNNTVDSKCAIMRAAFRQFEKKGYYQTGIRDIAVDANVSTGLVNHHFESKKKLATQVIAFFWSRADEWTEHHIDPKEDPVLYDAVATRWMNRQMMGEKYRRFYMDSLREDIFFDSLTRSTNSAVIAFRKKHFSVPDQDLVLLYGSILPYEVEKALILKKSEQMFQNISYEDIPFYICLTAFEKIVPEAEIKKADEQARAIVDAHVDELYRDITDEEILEFIAQRNI